jgi:hypothetical protein
MVVPARKERGFLLPVVTAQQPRLFLTARSAACFLATVCSSAQARENF